MLIDGPSRHVPASNARQISFDGALAHQGLDDQPLPHKVRGCVTLGRIVVEPLGDERTDGDRREEPHPLHPLSNGGHELHRQLVGNLVQPERVERALARADWVVRAQKRNRGARGEITRLT